MDLVSTYALVAHLFVLLLPRRTVMEAQPQPGRCARWRGRSLCSTWTPAEYNCGLCLCTRGWRPDSASPFVLPAALHTHPQCLRLCACPHALQLKCLGQLRCHRSAADYATKRSEAHPEKSVGSPRSSSEIMDSSLGAMQSSGNEVLARGSTGFGCSAEARVRMAGTEAMSGGRPRSSSRLSFPAKHSCRFVSCAALSAC